MIHKLSLSLIQQTLDKKKAKSVERWVEYTERQFTEEKQMAISVRKIGPTFFVIRKIVQPTISPNWQNLKWAKM